MGSAVCRAEVCEDWSCDGSTVRQELSDPSVLGQKLLSAARDGDSVTVRVCIASGLDVDIRQPLKLLTMDRFNSGDPVRQRGFTPLMYAAQSGHDRCVQALIAAKANVNSHDEDGTTPLHLACSSGDLGVFSALVDAGADPHALDDDGQGLQDYLPGDVTSDPIELGKWKKAFTAVFAGRSLSAEAMPAPSSEAEPVASVATVIGQDAPPR
mmetsp:Transcript_39183/g.101341  ORF Transcript_39183/g.101341 Transcript_39183/m.101341 type:complete len:211 (-) Transcript_39183:67-699(-)